MPNLGLSAEQSEALAEFLLAAPDESWFSRLREALPRPRYWYFPPVFVGGLLLGAAVTWLFSRRRAVRGRSATQRV